jgi:hypothetical protein
LRGPHDGPEGFLLVGAGHLEVRDADLDGLFLVFLGGGLGALDGADLDDGEAAGAESAEQGAGVRDEGLVGVGGEFAVHLDGGHVVSGPLVGVWTGVSLRWSPRPGPV